jgi:hypothetical protein
MPGFNKNFGNFTICPPSHFPALSRKPMPLSANTSQSLIFRRVLNLTLGIVFLLEIFIPDRSPVLLQALIALAAVASMAALNRQLPLQNVLLAAGITALIGGVAHGLSARLDLSIPFGPIVFYPEAGGKLFNAVPWTIPLLWVIAVFNARGVMRLILRPWRKTRSYGWWLIGFTAALTMAFDLALEPFAVHARELWHWGTTRISLTWQGASPMNYLGWFFVTLLILAFITPSLIRKQPGSAGKDYHPLCIWVGALLLFAISAAGLHQWLAVAFDAVVAAVTLVLAVRGAKW